MKKSLFWLLSAFSLSAQSPESPSVQVAPLASYGWFTGPLLCPAYSVLPQGGYNVEPYMFVVNSGASYSSDWKKSRIDMINQSYSYTLVQLGLTNRFNISFAPQFFYQSRKNHAAANIGDVILESYYMLLQEKPYTAKPGITISFKANVPLGRYRNLSPDGFVSEAIGGGSWRPTLAVAIGKQYPLYGHHILVARAFFGWQLKNSFPASGFHAYGGGYGTIGTLTMTPQYTTIMAFEYNFTKHWVFACDFEWQHNGKIIFKGSEGFIDFDRKIPASNGAPSSEQISMAPAIEYNFNPNVGLIAGCWFTLAGRNSLAFYSPTIALNVVY